MTLIRSILSFILIIFIYVLALVLQFIAFILNSIIKLIDHKSKKNEKTQSQPITFKGLR